MCKVSEAALGRALALMTTRFVFMTTRFVFMMACLQGLRKPNETETKEPGLIINAYKLMYTM